MSEMDEVIKDFLIESLENLDRLDREFVELERAPDGWLLLGAAEAAAGIPTGFQRVVRGELTYLRPA